MMVIVVDSFVLFPPFGSTVLKPDLLGRNGRTEREEEETIFP